MSITTYGGSPRYSTHLSAAHSHPAPRPRSKSKSPPCTPIAHASRLKIPTCKALPIQQPRLQRSLSSFNNRPIDGATIMPDARSSSQSSPDINTSKQFAVVLQNIFRSIDVNPDDVDYRICRRGFQYISGANRAKQMEVFTGVGPNEFEVISAITEDRSLAFLKPRLTYDACSKVLIVKMPSALHKAPLDELKTVLERKLDYLPSHPGQSVVHANAHMNRSIRFDNSEFVPDMLLSLRDISKRTNEPSMFLLVGECAFSQNEAILRDKLKKIIVELPDLVTVMMIVIREDALYNLPQQKSATWEFFKSHGTLLSQKEFLALCADLSEPICLGKSITVGGHTWHHLATVEYFIWVREVGGNPINIDNSGTDSSARGVLFPEIRMGEVDTMFDKAISAFKDSIILFFERLGESFETGEIDEAIGQLKISWTDCWGHLTGGMKDTVKLIVNMSSSQAATSSQPIYVPPDAICEQLPRKWAKLVAALGEVMREIPNKAAEDDEVREWMYRFKEVSAQIEEVRKFATNMSAELPRYPEETEEAISSGFLMLVALRNRFPPKAAKSKPKPAPEVPRGSQVVGEVRQSQHQLEKAAVGRENEGDQGLPHTENSVANEVRAVPPSGAPGVSQEQAAAIVPIDPLAPSKPSSHLSNHLLPLSNTLLPTLEPPSKPLATSSNPRTTPESSIYLVSRSRGFTAPTAGKKRCDKTGKTGKKHKNTEGPTASSATTSKKPRTSPVPIPPPSSAPPKTMIHVRPRIVSRLPTLQEGTSPVVVPPTFNPPPTTPSISHPPPPLFLPSSATNTPAPQPSLVEVNLQDNPQAFSGSPSGLLDEAPFSKLEADDFGEDLG
ncbi:hypothetical protein PISMIDRAFT_12212 [Pisolithus microcarpus 441]|uniref:Uncharacterized protein n=1 Tax=Pisolithus microcarpus 441 TaxID=765257 RepID=A0A0C9YXV2_9AGAM|nr:hypothetical protein PISMIDRAFT_12212 [Pisolithus microcarpus 441]